MSYLRGQRSISVLVSNHSRKGQRDICNGDNELGVADIVLSPAVGDVVNPLVLVLQVDEALVLTRVPVVAAWIVGVLTAVQTPDDPPVAGNLKQIFLHLQSSVFLNSSSISYRRKRFWPHSIIIFLILSNIFLKKIVPFNSDQCQFYFSNYF